MNNLIVWDVDTVTLHVDAPALKVNLWWIKKTSNGKKQMFIAIDQAGGSDWIVFDLGTGREIPLAGSSDPDTTKDQLQTYVDSM